MPDTETASSVIAAMASLAVVMRDESSRLELHAHAQELAELADAKARLVGSLEHAVARAERLAPGWPAALDGETRARLADAAGDLRAASLANAALLERHIELSAELMSAVSAEARRATGSRAYAYGARGTIARADLTTPISLNGEF